MEDHSELMKLFNEIMVVGDKPAVTAEFKDISSNDMHIIEAIGIRDPRSMSFVAKDLGITIGTLTIAINNLVKKSYVKRVRSELDRRVVLISLTDKGLKAYHHFEDFHKKMLQATLNDMGRDQTDAIMRALKNLSGFLENYGKNRTESI